MKFVFRSLAVSALLATRAAAANPEPIISVSVNDSRAAEVFRGMPMLVSTVLVHPSALDTNAAPILIAAAQGPWTNALRLDISDAAGNLQSWPFQITTITSNTTVLDSVHFAQFDRWLTPEQTLMLATGKHTLVATLNKSNVTVPGAWKGEVDSVLAEVNIRDEPATLSQIEAENKYSQLALYKLFAGNGPAALDHANQLLTLSSTNIAGLKIKSMALNALGRPMEAEASVEQAISETYARNPAPREPPTELFQMRRELQNTIFAPYALTYAAANHLLTLSWAGHTGLPYQLESSSDLVAWTLLSTNFTVSSNRYSFTVDLQDQRRFFRVVQ